MKFLWGNKHNYLVSKKHKSVCKVLNYIKHLLILVSTVTSCVSISAFAPLVSIPIGITRSAVVLKIFAITAEIKKYKSITKNKKAWWNSIASKN